MSIIEGLCKGHGCLDKSEIVTFTAILKSTDLSKNVESSAVSSLGQQTTSTCYYGDDFFQRLQAASADNGEEHPSFAKEMTRYTFL